MSQSPETRSLEGVRSRKSDRQITIVMRYSRSLEQAVLVKKVSYLPMVPRLRRAQNRANPYLAWDNCGEKAVLSLSTTAWGCFCFFLGGGVL